VFTLFVHGGAENRHGIFRSGHEEGLGGVIPDPFAAGMTLIIAGLFYMASSGR
jgi:hypothetical protein